MLKNQDIITVTITGYTSDGEGVARFDGEVVFIPHAIAGETVRARIVNVGKTVAHAEILDISEPSAHRIASDCPYFPRCGGCDFRHMDYEEELTLKRQRVIDALTRIGGVEPGEVPITGSEKQEGYRNKVQFPVGVQKGKPCAGFCRARTHEIISIDSCRIQPDCADAARRAVLNWMREHKISAYNERSHTGIVRHIHLRCGFKTGQVLVCVVANCKDLPQKRALCDALKSAVSGLTTVVVSYHEKRSNSVLGDRFETLYGDGTIEDILCGLRFRLSARSFYQINRDQAERLYEKALALADLKGTETALDLYCGAGTITLCMAKRVKKVYGVEIIDAAIEDAKENAKRNQITNAEFFCADAGQAAQRFAQSGEVLDVIVVDPPRKGLSGDVVDAILQMQPKRLVYVSCDPATLARDVKLLCEGGYRMEKAEAFDLFPRCAHVESICLLVKKEALS